MEIFANIITVQVRILTYPDKWAKEQCQRLTCKRKLAEELL